MRDRKTYYGKFRGIVVNNLDPEKRGRIQARVPSVFGDAPSPWALPCVPVLGKGMGFFSVPPVGAGVWVEFEQGSRDHPIWTGCFAASAADLPGTAREIAPPVSGMAMETVHGNSLVVSDLPPAATSGGIVLKGRAGAMIVVNESGIYMSNGKGASIVMVGPTVDINTGALTVM